MTISPIREFHVDSLEYGGDGLVVNIGGSQDGNIQPIRRHSFFAIGQPWNPSKVGNSGGDPVLFTCQLEHFLNLPPENPK